MSQSGRSFVTRLLFPCPAPTYTIDSFPGELVWAPRPPGAEDCSANEQLHGARPDRAKGTPEGRGDTVPCLMLPCESARFLIIFFHSNAEDLGRCRWFCQFLRDQFQCHVLAVEYPGYGVCGGEATREGIVANALAALHFATEVLDLPLDRIKIFGRSIGTGPALHLAARHKVAGLVLVTPFLSIRSLFQDRIGPLSAFVDEWFPNEEAIREVKSPMMIIHGRMDKIIPCHHGETLYKMCTARKLFISPKAMEHNANLTVNIAYLIMPMFRFFSLPDYSFRELTVPSWAFDKRRSSRYVRPAMEVCSRARMAPGAVDRPALVLPEGDREELPVDQLQDAPSPVESAEDLRGRARSAQGDEPAADYEVSSMISNPLVLHCYEATKQRYDFNGGGLVLEEEEEEEAEEDKAAKAKRVLYL